MRVMLALTLICAASSSFAAERDRLGDQRWREIGYGVSLLPPKGAHVIDDPPGDALVAFVDADGTQFTLTIREALNAMDVNTLKANAARQLTIPFPSWVPMDDPDPITTLANHPAGRVYMAIPDKDKGDWVMGHVFVLLDDFLFINLQMQAPAASFADAHQTFTAVAKSIALMDPAELDAMRTKQLEAGDAWLKSLDHDRFVSANPPSQLFRILVADKDVGFMKLTVGPGEQLGLKGHTATIQAQVQGAGGSLTHAQECFESADGKAELWITHMTQRGERPVALPMPEGANPQAINLRETGTRDDKGIEVITETRSRIETHNWPVPQIAFLSQFQKLLMGPLLPRQRTSLAFYAYSAEVKKVSLLTLHVEPITQGVYRGGYAVSLRPAPTIREQTMIYTADGALAEWRPGDGRVFRATTPTELKKLWDGRE